jgi:acyl-[acyl-carrier-protein]-phospholipid O-acyltransferase/long-chain-fatty-acid--[acyl-carrier-protein] ligase
MLVPLLRRAQAAVPGARGGRREPFSAPRLLVIANHQSFLDGVILGAFLPVDAVFVVHTDVTRHALFRLVLSLSDYLTVDPTNPMAMKRVVRLIESGRPVVIFPEGRITLTGSLMKVYDGPAFVAARTGAVIAPVRLDGATRSYFSRLSGSHPRELLPRITVSLQPPTAVAMPVGETGRMRRRKAGESMRRIMQDMIFRSQPIQTLYHALIDAMRVYGRRRKLVEDMKQTEYSYNALLKMTLVLGLLVRRQSARGETVGILLPNLAATLCMVIGTTAFRRVPALLNYTAGTEGMQSACVAARISRIVTSRKFLETARLQGQVDALQDITIIYLEDLQPSVTLTVKLWAALHLFFPRLLGRRVGSDSPAVVLFTSGSEGRPKGVVLSHRAILSNIAQIRAITDFTIEDRIFNALPIFHSFGLTAGGLLPILSGTQLFLYPSPLHYRLIPRSSTTATARSCSHQRFSALRQVRPLPTSTACATSWRVPKSCPRRCATCGSKSSAGASTRVTGSPRRRRWCRSTRPWRPAPAAAGNCCRAWRRSWCQCPASTVVACCTCAAPMSCWVTSTT